MNDHYRTRSVLETQGLSPEQAFRISHEQAQAHAAQNNARITAQPVQHLIADPRETQLIAMFRCIDDRAQATMIAMMGVAFNMHKRGLK